MSIRALIKKSIVPVSSAIVGGLVVLAALKLSPTVRSKINGEAGPRQHDEQIFNNIFQNGIRQQFDSLFDDDFIAQKFGAGTLNEISEREDDRFVYYDIQVDDVNSTSINTKVDGGYVTITGTIEKKLDSDGKEDGFSGQSVFKSSFNRTFPLPDNVDQNKMQTLTEKDKVILKFPKTRA